MSEFNPEKVEASVGFRIPESITLQEGNPPQGVSTGDIFAGKKVVVFGVPGAFTNGCSKTHMPGYLAAYEKYLEKGIDLVCITVNDPFVTSAWVADQKAEGKIRVLADINAELTVLLGMDFTVPFGGTACGLRTKRFSAYVEDSEIKIINVEPDGRGLTCSLSPSLLSQIEKL